MVEYIFAASIEDADLLIFFEGEYILRHNYLIGIFDHFSVRRFNEPGFAVVTSITAAHRLPFIRVVIPTLKYIGKSDRKNFTVG